MTIKFEIDESLEYRGGSHYEYFYADDINEVIEALKDAWYQSGIHRHGGELFLTAHLNDSDGKETSLFLGNCSLDSEEDIYSAFEFPLSESDDWYRHGLFVDGLSGAFFESVLEVLFDTSSPDRVLGSYLYKVNKILPELDSDLKANIGIYVLADIFNFAKLHGKMNQMHDWILSEEGKKFLTSQESFFAVGEKVVGSIENQEIDDLETFIEKNKDRVGLQPSFPA